MKSWKFENYTVNEVEFDGDLHALEFIRNDGKYLGVVIASCKEDMDENIGCLDCGSDPIKDSWEDGMLNTLNIHGWGRETEEEIENKLYLL